MQQFTQRARITGGKRIDFTNDEGKRFARTVLFITTPLDHTNDNLFGQAAAEYSWGDETNFERIPHPKEGFDADVTFENVFNGKTQKMIVLDVKPVLNSKPMA